MKGLIDTLNKRTEDRSDEFFVVVGLCVIFFFFFGWCVIFFFFFLSPKKLNTSRTAGKNWAHAVSVSTLASRAT